jgi:hypothetical protein
VVSKRSTGEHARRLLASGVAQVEADIARRGLCGDRQ